jgi:hypothetical protein
VAYWLLQIVPYGKTLEKVATSLLMTSSVLWYERHPLRHDTARVQMRLDELEVLLRVQRRGALDPRMIGSEVMMSNFSFVVRM